MAYKTADLLAAALKAIDEKKLFFIEDVVAYLPCSKSTFYEHFPHESDGYKEISEALSKVKTLIKVSMRSKWYNSDNAALQMGLMKLIGTEEEAQRLSGTRITQDITSNGESLNAIKIEIIREPIPNKTTDAP